MAAPLKRRIRPGVPTGYSIGGMVGAGIYVLAGSVAGAAGIWVPEAPFLVPTAVPVFGFILSIVALVAAVMGAL
ncbi:hypothetical protein A9Q94_01705 [Rhodobacterales bacterium 56_14_T64]|nr:hypothetical protein A9Q94_01705 [Rhodobacterales bacterium 56_14_T64]